MDLLHAIILGLLQGLTEFLPVSSSAHLILLPKLAGWADQGLLYNVGAHFGSLLALLSYFRKDLARMSTAWVNSFGTGRNRDADLVWLLVIAVIPICLAGLLFRHVVEYLRQPLVIAGATLLFALLLWWADRCGKRQRDVSDLHVRDAIVIGLFQALAIIPGASRAGVALSAGLLLGLNRQAAARFSLLLAIPTILLAWGYELLGVSLSALQVDWVALVTVGFASFLSAYLTVHWFLMLVERTGMLPYVIYRLLLGSILFALFL